MYSKKWKQLVALALFLCLVAIGRRSRAAISYPDRYLELPETIYQSVCDDPAFDLDKDGLKDRWENALADAWRPYFVFDEKELDDPPSLLPFEPVVLFQVHPGTNRPDGTKTIRINWAFIWKNDGGFRGSWAKSDSHHGDTQSGFYDLLSWDNGNTWYLWQMNLYESWNSPWYTSTWDASMDWVQWTAPHSVYDMSLPQRPSPKIWASAGKHHQYTDGEACENQGHFKLNEDCGGGPEVLANLTSLGKYHNVGEANNHPEPFVSDLSQFYAGEYVWWAHFTCGGMPTFLGGADQQGSCYTNTNDGTTVNPVHALLELSFPALDAEQAYEGSCEPDLSTSAWNSVVSASMVDRGNLFHTYAVTNPGSQTTFASNATNNYQWNYLGHPSETVLTGAPVIVSWAGARFRFDIFTRGMNGNLYHNGYDEASGGWFGFESLGGPMGGYPAVVSDREKQIHIFVRGSNGHLMHRRFNGDWGGWEQWEDLGGQIVGPVEAVSWGPGRIDVFVTGTDLRIYHKTWDNGAWSPSFTGFEPLGGPQFFGPVTATSWGPKRLDVFGRGSDGKIYNKIWNGQWWYPTDGSWQEVSKPLFGSLAGPLKAVAPYFGRIELFGGISQLPEPPTTCSSSTCPISPVVFGHIYHRTRDLATPADESSSWSNYWTPYWDRVNLPVAIHGPPAAVARNSGEIHLFGRSWGGFAVCKEWDKAGHPIFFSPLNSGLNLFRVLPETTESRMWYPHQQIGNTR